MLLDGQAIGFVGELHPKWRQGYELAQAPVLFELELDAVLQRPVPQFATVGKFQAVERDIAVIVAENVTHAALMAAIHSAPTSGLLRAATLFDVYRAKPVKAGEANTASWLASGEKSLAVRLTLNGEDATLTDAQIESSVQAVLAQLARDVGARLRS